MLAFLTALPGMISGLFGSINNITNAISNAKIAEINAKTEEERIKAQTLIGTLQARRDLMIAESGHSRLNIIMRFIISLGPASILLKIFFWDKVVGSLYGCSGSGKMASALSRSCYTFNTDPLDANLWNVVTIVLGFYFLYEGGSTITRIIAGRK